MSVETQSLNLTSDILDTAYKKSELTHLSLNKAKRFLDEKYNNIAHGLKINVLGVSLQNAKSRVETQTKICIQIVTDKGEKVQRWSHLKLPEVFVNTPKIRKSKYNSNLYNDVDEESILNLDAMVVCASDLSKSAIHMCVGCVQRERKRLLKRDTKKNPIDSAIDKEISDLMKEHENERIIIFNCNQIIEFGGGDCILPSRITCYCRHHKEKIGFCIYFVLKDNKGSVVATGLSPPILITDDHKSNPFKKNGRKRVKLEQSTLPPSPTLTSSSLTPPQSINDNEVTSPLASQQNDSSVLVDYTSTDSIYKHVLPGSKTVPSNAVKVEQVPNPAVNPLQFANGLDINMTPLSPISSPEMNMNYNGATYSTLASTSATIANVNNFDTTVPPNLTSYAIANNNILSSNVQNIEEFPHINIKSEPGLISDPQLNNFNMALYNNIPSTTSALVNNQLLVDQNIVIPSNNITETLETNQKLYNAAAAAAAAATNYNINRVKMASDKAPYINRLIPNEGPLSGGIEVTVLGVNFMEGLVVVFGDVEAQTQYYSESTLICILPPANIPGPVPVSVKSYQINIPIQNLMIFNYKNETDKQLMELALQVVGLRMTGKIDDARNIAMKIVSISDNGEDFSKDMGVEGRTNSSYIPSDNPILKSSINVLQRYIMDLNIENKKLNNGVMEVNSLENEIIQSLASVMTLEEPLEENEINLTTVAGHSLLHFAVILNMTTLIKWLIALDIDVDIADINGNTALHFAIIQSNALVVKILVNDGEADLYAENCNGKTPLDMAYEINNDAIIDVIESAIEDIEETSEISSVEEEEEINDSSLISENLMDEDLSVEANNLETENVQNIDGNIVNRNIDYYESNGNKIKQRKSLQTLNMRKLNNDNSESNNPSEMDETDIYEAKPIESESNNHYERDVDDVLDSKIISPEVAVNKETTVKYKLLQKDLPQYAMALFGNNKEKQSKSELGWFQNIQQKQYFSNFPNLSNFNYFSNFPNFTNFSSITAFNFSFTNPFPIMTQHWNDLRKKQFDEWRLNQSLYTLLKRDSSAVIVNDDDLEEEKKKEKANETKSSDKKSIKKSNRSSRKGSIGNKEASEDGSEREFSEENEEFYEYCEDYDYDEYIENGLFENDPRLTDRERRLLAKQKHSRENRKRLRRDRTLFLFWIPTILVMIALALLRVFTFRKILLETVNSLILIPLGLEPYEILTINHDHNIADIADII